MAVRQSGHGCARPAKLCRAVIAAGAMLVLGAGAAGAGSISTPILFLGGTDQLLCVANNVSGSSIKVKVRIVGNATTSTQTCTLPAGDRDGCQGFLNGESGYCKIFNNNISTSQLKSRVRGVLFTRDTTAPFALQSVVQAE
ncbi:MAG TPA: hypothetical protein VGA77_17850 [Propylenella sp.]